METIWNSIKNQFNSYKKDFIYIIIICVLLGSLSLSIEKCSGTKYEYENNIAALLDSVTYLKAKNGDLVASKLAFEGDLKLLKQVNKDLYDVIENLKLKGSVTQVIHVDGTIENEVHDTTYVVQHDTLYKGFTKEFNFNNEYRTLEGLVKYQSDTLGVNITKDIVNFDYNVAMDKNNRIYVTSSNPYVKYKEITGFTVPKQKKKHFSLGPSVSFGYDPINNKAAFTIGGSVVYNLYQF